MASSPAYAFVTLLTSDSYLPGALALVAALHDVHASTQPPTPFKTVCLITPEILAVGTQATIRKAFDIVIGVDIIRENTAAGLNLLGRPDLALVLTKLHAFRLSQFDKVIFLDADILPVRPLAHLFALPYAFSAVPDVGWPDIFNSGLMAFQPGGDKFDEIMQIVRRKGSWDGGDQGVLNEWRGSDWNRLSFTYNTTPTAAYTYAPAYERFGKEINAIHFIGANKPWKSLPFRAPGSGANADVSNETVASSLAQSSYGYSALVDKWFNVYDRHYRPAVPFASQPQDVSKNTSFQVPTYVSAWNQPLSKRPPGDQGGLKGPGMDLDELRTMNLGGLGAAGQGPRASSSLPDMGIGYLGPSSEHGDAEYVTMPMPGQSQLLDYHQRPVDEPLERSYSYHPEPSQPPPRNTESETFQEPPDWAAPANATSSPPAHLFRPKPSQSGPDFEQRHHVDSGSHSQLPQSHDPGAHGGAQGGHHHQRRPSHHHRPQQHYHRNYHHPTGPPLERQEQREDSSEEDQGYHQPWVHHRHLTVSLNQEQEHQQLPSTIQHDWQGAQHHHEGSEQYKNPWSHQASTLDTPATLIRTRSPPMVTWNPAVEPPPDFLPPGAFDHPAAPHFTNVWDQPQHSHHNRQPEFDHKLEYLPPTRNEYVATTPRPSEDFFKPPTMAGIPSQLVQEGHYSALTSQNPQPDRRKVAPVFPWESAARPTPGRVFPPSDTPPLSSPRPEVSPVVSAGFQSLATSPATNLQRTAPADSPSPAQNPSPPDPPSFPRATRQFSYDWKAEQASSTVEPGRPRNHGNVWDSVPSIQKYVTKLVKPSPSMGGLPPPKEEKVEPYSPGKTWSEQMEESDASSHEADDEDDESDLNDGSGYVSPPRGNGRRGGKAGRSGSGHNSPAVRPGSSRRSSEQTARTSTSEKGIMTSGSGSGKASGTPKYRSQSVQTVSKETQSRGVQVNRPPYSAAASKRSRNISIETSSASVSPMDPRVPLPAILGAEPGLLRDNHPVIARQKREMTVAFAPTPIVTTTSSAPSEQQATSPSVPEPSLELQPFPMISSTPTITTPAATSESHRTYPFSRARQYSPTTPTASNRDSAAFSTTTSNRDSLISTDTLLTPQSSVIFNGPPFPPPHIRTSSNETTLTITSPPTSDGPRSPAEDEALESKERKVPPGRRWDPRRNVDIFKSQNQDVLARFLSMGSWDSQDQQQQQ
ncbi:glycogenin glucosyltransferase [Tulasnella sp. JGI-2019a]|nr:glycogenin glucosyltransferase [Tulasnella sp. JGI-2019a]